MANKRQAKKNLKKKQRQQLKNLGYKKVDKLSKKELDKIISSESEKENKKRRRKESVKARKNRELREETIKRFELEKQSGIPMDKWGKGTVGKLKKYTLDEIKKGNFSYEDFPELFSEKTIDYDKDYPIPNGQKLSFAFRSLDGDTNIQTALNHYSNYSIEDLIENLKNLKNTPLTGSRNVKGKRGKNIGSSGKAGTAEVHLHDQNSLQDLYSDFYNDDRRAKAYVKKRSKSAQEKGLYYSHSNIDYHWQYITQKTEDGKARAYTKISIRKLLIIGNALMDAIKEDERKGFYDNYRYTCVEIIPLMDKLLP